MDTPVQDDEERLIYDNSVWTLDIVEKANQERWTIGTDDEDE